MRLLHKILPFPLFLTLRLLAYRGGVRPLVLARVFILAILG